MNYQIDVQNALEPEPQGVPSEETLIEWAAAVLSHHKIDDAEMTVRLVDAAEISELNQNYRHKSGPTNILSFSAELPEALELPLLGDVIICAEVVANEAQVQNKKLLSHWAHMVIHGTLHLLGYDHVDNVDAELMEAKEIEILAKFGYPNPYIPLYGDR